MNRTRRLPLTAEAISEVSMDGSVIAALITGGAALIVAVSSNYSSVRNAKHTAENAKAIELLKIENDQKRVKAEQQKAVSRFSEPLARAAYDLQSRLYNILELGFVRVFLMSEKERERMYALNNTTFLVAQYACWTELIRREVQFLDLGENDRTRQILHLQDDISGILGTDFDSPELRIFAGEFRAIGEYMIEDHGKEMVCMGYGRFLVKMTSGTNTLIDAVRLDIENLQQSLEQATPRITRLQNALVDLLLMLDPRYIRFPRERRLKSQL